MRAGENERAPTRGRAAAFTRPAPLQQTPPSHPAALGPAPCRQWDAGRVYRAARARGLARLELEQPASCRTRPPGEALVAAPSATEAARGGPRQQALGRYLQAARARTRRGRRAEAVAITLIYCTELLQILTPPHCPLEVAACFIRICINCFLGPSGQPLLTRASQGPA